MNLRAFSVLLMLSLASLSIAQPTDHSVDSTTTRIDISFYSSHSLVKGWLFMPVTAGDKKLPVIIMAPGFSGTKECTYQFYGAHFAKAGFAVLLFDYPNFGESDGQNRGEVDPWIQVQAYRDAISYSTTLDAIDPERIGVWGGSYSGGHAMVVSAVDKRVKCLVAMTPFISGAFYVQNMPKQSRDFLNSQFNADRLSRVQGGEPVMIPVVSDKKGDFCAISGKNAWDFVESFKHYAPSFENKVTLKSLEMQLEYEPGAYITYIDTIPKLFIVAQNDEMIPEPLIIETYNKASEPKQLQYIKGYHFSPYQEKLQEACEMASKWFAANL